MPNGSLTNRGSEILLKYLLQNEAMPPISPHWGIATATPSKSTFSEITGNGYSRVPSDATYFDVPTVGNTTSIKDITLPKSLGYEGSVYGVGLFESASASSPLVYWHSSDVETIKTDDAYQILAGGIDFSFTAASQMSQWLQNAIINCFFRGNSLAIASISLDIAYCTTAPTALIFGTEPVGGGYLRKSVIRQALAFTVSNQDANWRNDLQFDYATAPQGDVQAIGYFDGAQYLFWGVAPVATINTNSAYVIGAGTTISLM